MSFFWVCQLIGDMICTVVSVSLCWMCGQSLLCSAAVTALVGMGLSPSCWTISPEGWVLSDIVALECMPCLKGDDVETSEASVVIANLRVPPYECLQFCPRAAECCYFLCCVFSRPSSRLWHGICWGEEQQNFVYLYTWFFSCSIMFSRFIHAFACISTSHSFMLQ